jgi:hypothetical protein
MTTTLPSDAELLAEATLAYHKLATGTAVVTARDSNGEQITYNLASQGNLKAYIQELSDRIALAADPHCAPRASQPMRLWL